MIAVHVASVRDRSGAPELILGMMENAPQIAKLCTDGACQSPKPATGPERLGPGPIPEVVSGSKDVRGFTVLYRRWAVERTFVRMSCCRRPARDYRRSLDSSLAWARPAACRFMLRHVARATSA